MPIMIERLNRSETRKTYDAYFKLLNLRALQYIRKKVSQKMQAMYWNQSFKHLLKTHFWMLTLHVCYNCS